MFDSEACKKTKENNFFLLLWFFYVTSNGQHNKNVHFYRLRWLNFRLLKKLFLMWKHQLRSITEECIDKLIFIEMKCQFYTKPTANDLVEWIGNRISSHRISSFNMEIQIFSWIIWSFACLRKRNVILIEMCSHRVFLAVQVFVFLSYSQRTFVDLKITVIQWILLQF